MQIIQAGPITIYFVPRKDWDDENGRTAGVYTGAWNYHRLVAHHAVMTSLDFATGNFFEIVSMMRRIKYVRPDLGGEVPYNWVIIKHINPNAIWVCEGRGLGWTGAHTFGYNSSVHAAAFWGNSDTAIMSEALLEGYRFCGRLMAPYVTLPTVDHRTLVPDTYCCGDGLRGHLSEIQPPFNSLENPSEVPELTEFASYKKASTGSVNFTPSSGVPGGVMEADFYDFPHLPVGTRITLQKADTEPGGVPSVIIKSRNGIPIGTPAFWHPDGVGAQNIPDSSAGGGADAYTVCVPVGTKVHVVAHG